MKANAKGKVWLEKMMADKQLHISEARLRHAQAVQEAIRIDENKSAPTVPVRSAGERVQ